MGKKILIVIFMIMMVITGTYVVMCSQKIMESIQTSIGEELSDALDTKVTIGDIKVVSFHELAIDNAKVYDRQDKLLLTASRAVLTFDPWQLVRGTASVGAIHELTFTSPEVNLYEQADGKLNAEDLLQQQQKKSSAFKGKIIVVAGKAILDTSRGNWRFDKLDGKMDFAKTPAVAFDMSGLQDEQPFTVKGNYGEKHYTIHLHTDRIALAKYNQLLPADRSVELVSGDAADVSLMVQNDGKELKYSGEGRLEEVGVKMGDTELRNVNGLIGLTQEHLYLYGTDEEIAGQNIHTSGTVTLNTDQPVLNLHITAKDFAPTLISADIPLTGAIGFDIHLTGTAENPAVDGTVTLAAGQLASYTVQAARGKIHYADNVLTVRDFAAKMFGGNVTGSGTVDLSTAEKRYSFAVKGDAEGEELTDFVANLRGHVNYQLHIAGERTGGMQVDGTVKMSAGSWQGVAFSSLDTGFQKTGSTMVFNYLTVGMEQGTLLAEGSVDEGLNLSVRGYNVSLAALALDKLPISGAADFTGRVTGTVDDPQFVVELKARNGQVFGQPFATAEGMISGNRETIALDGLTLTAGETRHSIAGTIGLTGMQAVNLTVKSVNARAENLVALLGSGEQLTGWVDNEVSISGPMDHMNMRGHVVLHDGSFRGHLVQRGEGYYVRDQGKMVLSDFIIQSLNTQIALAGEISENNELNLDIAAQNIDLGRLQFDFPYPVSGKALFAGKLTGTPQMPQFSGQLKSTKVSVNGQELGRIDTHISLIGDNVNLDGSCYQGQGRYVFEGGFNLAAHDLFGSLSVENGQIAPLVSICNLPVREVGGVLNGQISFNGTTDNPTIYLNGNITNGKIKNYPVETVELDVGLENHVITVNNMIAKQGNGAIVVRGRADLQGQVNLEAGGYNLDAGIIPALFDTGFTAAGKLQFAAQVTGAAAAPHAALSLEVDNGSVANAAFDNLYGLFVVDKESIHVNQLYLSKGPYRASAYGLVPLKALRTDGYQQATVADQMNLTLKLDQANLSILPLLSKDISWAAGPTKGEVTIGGTLAQPTANGQILVENGAIKLAALGEPIQKVGVDIQLENGKIVIKSFTGQMGGGSYSLTGTTSLKGWGLDDYNLVMSFDKLGIVNQYFKGPLNGSLFLTSVQGMPKLSGKLFFENDTINIPFVPQLESSGKNLALDLELAAGNRVRLYNPYLYDIFIDGKAKFTGTLSSPKSSGHINAVRGSVSYLRTQFKVTEGYANFTQVDSLIPNVNLNAETSLDQVTVDLNVSGPLDEMNIKLTSEPAMRQEEILSLLTLRSRYLDRQKSSGNMRDVGLGRDEVVSMLDAGLQMRFISAMEDTLRDALGLDQFRLVRDTLSDSKYKESSMDREVYNLEIGKYITDRLMLSYTMGVDHKDHDMGFQYDLTRKISLTGSIDEENHRQLGLSMRFNFK